MKSQVLRKFRLIRVRTSPSTFFLLALMPMVQGCMTDRLWQNVPHDRTSYLAVVGVGDPDASGHRQLLLKYVANNTPETIRKVPLDAGGLPFEPFCYHGASRDSDQILAELGEQKIDSISKLQLKPSNGELKTLPLVVVERAAKRDQLQAFYSRWTPSGDVDVVAYKIDAQGHLHVPAHPPGGLWHEVEPGYSVLVIPETQKRPLGSVAGERMLPTILTPVAIVADVVLMPFIAIGYMSAGLSR